MKTSHDPEAIRQEMAMTRVKIDETLDEIGHRVSPSTLESAAKSGLKHARTYLEAEADARLAHATSQLKEAGSTANRFIREHPLATAVIGVALGLMLARVPKTVSKKEKEFQLQ